MDKCINAYFRNIWIYYQKNMKKTILVPLLGFVILVICIFYYLNPPTEKKSYQKKIADEIFNTQTFFKTKTIDKKELGEFYIVNFFASWCKPCLAEHPLLMAMKDQGIKIIGINFRDDEENFLSWISENGNPFEYVIRDDGTIAYKMGLIGVPETYFISNNEIINKIQGPLFYEDVEKYL